MTFDTVSNTNMATYYSTVIVFGPTGEVGGATALEASRRGAKVWLAMRDPAKPIDGITKEQEQQGSFSRIQADLSDAESVKTAVRQSGAKAAFTYYRPLLSPPVQAMKDAGIEYVVFLSSFSVSPGQDIREIPQSEFIPYGHAQIEIALEDASIDHTALRPGHFASNGVRKDLDKSSNPYKARIGPPDVISDCISPGDIGRVAGAVLVNRPSSSPKEVIYLAGPRLITTDEQWSITKKLSSREIEVITHSPEEYTQCLIDGGLPPPAAKYLVKIMERTNIAYPEPLHQEWVANIKKYSGYEPTAFEDYVKSLDL